MSSSIYLVCFSSLLVLRCIFFFQVFVFKRLGHSADPAYVGPALCPSCLKEGSQNCYVRELVFGYTVLASLLVYFMAETLFKSEIYFCPFSSVKCPQSDARPIAQPVFVCNVCAMCVS